MKKLFRTDTYVRHYRLEMVGANRARIMLSSDDEDLKATLQVSGKFENASKFVGTAVVESGPPEWVRDRDRGHDRIELVFLPDLSSVSLIQIFMDNGKPSGGQMAGILKRVGPPPQTAVTSQSVSAQPSFNCGAAKSASARLICSDPELSNADGALGKAFQNATRGLEGDNKKVKIQEQVTWLRERNRRCKLDDKLGVPVEELTSSKPCILSWINIRIGELSGTLPSSIANAGIPPAQFGGSQEVLDKKFASMLTGNHPAQRDTCMQPMNQVLHIEGYVEITPEAARAMLDDNIARGLAEYAARRIVPICRVPFDSPYELTLFMIAAGTNTANIVKIQNGRIVRLSNVIADGFREQEQQARQRQAAIEEQQRQQRMFEEARRLQAAQQLANSPELLALKPKNEEDAGIVNQMIADLRSTNVFLSGNCANLDYIGGEVSDRSVDGSAGVFIVRLLIANRLSDTIESTSPLSNLCAKLDRNLAPGQRAFATMRGAYRKYDSGWRLENILRNF
ncbi:MULTISPECIES: lysozyme inhibitor LprI family protein [unclassified Bradyrhizobium]